MDNSAVCPIFQPGKRNRISAKSIFTELSCFSDNIISGLKTAPDYHSRKSGRYAFRSGREGRGAGCYPEAKN